MSEAKKCPELEAILKRIHHDLELPDNSTSAHLDGCRACLLEDDLRSLFYAAWNRRETEGATHAPAPSGEGLREALVRAAETLDSIWRWHSDEMSGPDDRRTTHQICIRALAAVKDAEKALSLSDRVGYSAVVEAATRLCGPNTHSSEKQAKRDLVAALSTLNPQPSGVENQIRDLKIQLQNSKNLCEQYYQATLSSMAHPTESALRKALEEIAAFAGKTIAGTHELLDAEPMVKAAFRNGACHAFTEVALIANQALSAPDGGKEIRP